MGKVCHHNAQLTFETMKRIEKWVDVSRMKFSVGEINGNDFHEKWSHWPMSTSIDWPLADLNVKE